MVVVVVCGGGFLACMCACEITCSLCVAEDAFENKQKDSSKKSMCFASFQLAENPSAL